MTILELDSLPPGNDNAILLTTDHLIPDHYPLATSGWLLATDHCVSKSDHHRFLLQTHAPDFLDALLDLFFQR